MEKIKLQGLTRQFDFRAEGSRTDENGNPIVSIAISSEYPVVREFGVEVLDHTPKAVDLSRLQNGGAFLVNHDQRDQVGVLENVRLDGDKVIRADVRFSRSQRGQEIMQDMMDGIRKHISVGYAIRKIEKEEKSNDRTTYRVTDWLPYEASTVAIPADPTVGVSRSAEMTQEYEVEVVEAESNEERAVKYTTDTTTEVSTVTEFKDDGTITSEETYTQHTVSKSEVVDEGSEEEGEDGERVVAVYAADKPIRESEEVEEVREESAPIITAVHDRSEDNNQLENPQMDTIRVADSVELTEKEQKEYSLIRGIEAMLTRGNSFELELSQDIARKVGRDAAGFYMPTSVRANTAAGSGTGAELVFTGAGSFIDQLRAKSVVIGLGAQVMQLNQKVGLPRQISGSNAQWM